MEPRAHGAAPLADSDADEVCLAVRGPRDLWLAHSRATLAAETIAVHQWDGDRWILHAHLGGPGAPAFRPQIALLGSGVAVAGCQCQDGIFVPSGLILPDDGPQRPWSVSANGAVYALSLSTHPLSQHGWLAWEEAARGGGRRIRAARLDSSGMLNHVPLPESPQVWRRSPVVIATAQGAWIVWVQGPPRAAGRIVAARWTANGSLEGEVFLDEADPAPQEAPAAVLGARGELVVTWHTRGRGGGAREVNNWLRLAVVSADAAKIELDAPAVQEPQARDQAGEDQGWEFPALAADTRGRIWLAGRSSHGFHVTYREPTGLWQPRVSISPSGWGGRGRRLAASLCNGQLLLARREPAGIELSTVAAAREPAVAPVSPGAGHATSAARSAPPRSRPQRQRAVLFGDLHQHSAHSDGCGTAEEIWVRARDERGLDFAALTDHDRFCRRAVGPATWKYLCDTADAFYETGRFVTFPAYEFTGARHPGPGHKCIYFGSGYPERIPDKDVERVFAAASQFDGIAVPHHVGWTGSDAEHHDPALQPVWEIFSVHGCYEKQGSQTCFPPRQDFVLPGHFVKDALDAGLRFGFISSTDSHGLLWHHGIAKKRDPFAAGLAAVIGAERDRASILAALRARRTYATTGARIRVHVDLEGAPMGSELPAGTRGALHVAIAGTARLARVNVVSRRREDALPIDGDRCEATLLIEDRPLPWDYLYVRAEQIDGETAWSSPIWIG